MKLLCPFCSQSVTVPDESAGRPTPCPLCRQTFQAPQLYAPPAVTPEKTDPVPVLPVVTPVEPRPAPKNDVVWIQEGTGDQRFRSFPIRREVIAWMAPVAMTIAFLLTFFRWDGLYPGGHAAYSQNAWQCLSAGLSHDRVAEDMWHWRTELSEALRSNWWLLPYLPLLVVTVILFWAEAVVVRTEVKLPAVVQSAMKYRTLLTAFLSAVLLFLLVGQWSSGLGLEKAVRSLVDQQHETAKSEATTDEKAQRWEMAHGRDLGSYNYSTTFWLRLAVLAHLIALSAIGLDAALQIRGPKPPPRVGVLW